MGAGESKQQSDPSESQRNRMRRKSDTVFYKPKKGGKQTAADGQNASDYEKDSDIQMRDDASVSSSTDGDKPKEPTRLVQSPYPDSVPETADEEQVDTVEKKSEPTIATETTPSAGNDSTTTAATKNTAEIKTEKAQVTDQNAQDIQASAPLSRSDKELDSLIDRLLKAANYQHDSNSFILSPTEITDICQKVRTIMLAQPTLIRIPGPVKVVGDTHGQFRDLVRLFDLCGYPPNSNYLFLGDYVDRGKQSLETILLLFCYKIRYPDKIHILRGNHECANVNRVYGFFDECKRRCSVKIWKTFTDVFNCLPLAGLVSEKIFCIHGGLSPCLKKMSDITAIKRPTEIPEEGLLNDLLWADPSEAVEDWEENDRGVSVVFGKRVLENFLAKHELDLVCRAHMVVEDGYEFFGDRRLVTIFSAPNYCGEFNNNAAIMNISKDLICSFEILRPANFRARKASVSQ